ncbi:DUF2771 family protein [Amycolatopsis sp. K13G38]|uniref:DUF2771 family protein n=1 Tax=Amycolatopsis acididurans TaxID=2724524 RepID=A0ABX1J8I0_9PSEU|nr:DUF2771 family protein [Amycolatopsis acididurans]NKQ55194.1 DUF2771 family protein [Amycolatopsis acididurans]
MRRSRIAVLLAGGALALTGCSAAASPPEITFYGDGHTVTAAPVVNCDALVRNCDKDANATARLKVRAGKPVQISVPSEVSDTPWLVNVQYADAAAGGQLKIKQQFFSPSTRLAYTATAPTPADQLVVVEVQRIGAAYAADQSGKPVLDENGNPQLVARSLWSLQIQPG